MKTLVPFLVIFFLLNKTEAQPRPAQWSKLYIQPDKRYIMRGDGKPFFWLGDTAWELIHRLHREEVDYYLKNRADKGFTVIQTVILAELDGLTLPNPYGHLPLKNNDPTQPNEAYFQHVDYVVAKANALGMIVGLLPTWGDKFNKKWGKGPEIFTPENARIYGQYVGKRYKGKGVIWILGGDRNPETEQHYDIIRAMADGIKAGNGNTQLMSFHPMGPGNSAAFFHKDDWLSINMAQSGHSAKNYKNYVFQRQNYALFPVKPTLDGEPRYEDVPVNFKAENDYFNSHDVRQAAWWSVLSGACGHTYGNNNIWQMFDPQKGQGVIAARMYWKKALDQEGATQMGYVRRLLESYAWHLLVPNQNLIKNENPDDASHQVAALSDKKDFLLAYTPVGRPLKIDLTSLTQNSLTAWWYNPRDGIKTKIGEFGNEKAQEFKPPITCPTCDWVLVVDSGKK
ncbi:MAG: glycoside hydrolase family 140 protein [Runella sp.]